MILVWILLAVLAVIIALLAVPLEWRFTVELSESHRTADSHFRWLFGLVRVPANSKVSADTDDQIGDKSSKPPKQKNKRNRKAIRKVLAVEGFVGRVLTLARRLIAAIHLRQLTLQARLGLGDPADTGQLWGVVGPLHGLLNIPKATRIDIEPDFFNEVLEVRSAGLIRVIPLWLLALLIRFLCSRITLRAFRAMRENA